MTTEILSNIYSSNQRICTQKITYNKYDDIHTLGQYYIKLAEVLYALDNPTAETNKAQLEADKAQLEQLIDAQRVLVDEYDTKEGQDG